MQGFSHLEIMASSSSHGSRPTKDSSNTSKSNSSSFLFSSDDEMIQEMFVDMDRQRQYTQFLQL